MECDSGGVGPRLRPDEVVRDQVLRRSEPHDATPRSGDARVRIDCTNLAPGSLPPMWLPEGFEAPESVEVADTGFHLRQIGPDDTDLDMVAVMGSQERLWSIYGEAWGWPPSTMTAEQDRADLQRHAEEMTRNESFNYALFDGEETVLVGCVYIDPPERVGADADISWWVIDGLVDSPVEQSLDQFIPEWVDSAWPFAEPRYVGVDLSWDEWLSLPESGPTH
jgi:hypothetical protein